MTKYIVFHVDYKSGSIVYLKYDHKTNQLYARMRIEDQWIHYMDLSDVARGQTMTLKNVTNTIDKLIDVDELVKQLCDMNVQTDQFSKQQKHDMYDKIRKEYMGICA